MSTGAEMLPPGYGTIYKTSRKGSRSSKKFDFESEITELLREKFQRRKA